MVDIFRPVLPQYPESGPSPLVASILQMLQYNQDRADYQERQARQDKITESRIKQNSKVLDLQIEQLVQEGKKREQEEAIRVAGEQMATVPGVVAGAGAAPATPVPLPQPTLAADLAQPGQPAPQVAGPVPEPPGVETGAGNPLTAAQTYIARKNQQRMATAETIRQKQDEDLALGNAVRVDETMHGALPKALQVLFPIGSLLPKTIAAAAIKPAPKQFTPVSAGGKTELIDNETQETLRSIQHTASPKATGGALEDTADIFPGLTGQELLAEITQKSPGNGALLKNVIEGRVDPTKVASMKSNDRKMLVSLASRIDPNFSEGVVASRVKTRNDFTSGAAAANKRSINTAIRHLGTLDNAIDALAPFGGWSTLANVIRNPYLQATGDPKITAIKDSALAVATEMAAALKGGAGRASPTEEEIKEQLKIFSLSNSKEQWKQSIRTKAELLGGRLLNLQNQWNDAFGGTVPTPLMVHKTSQETAKKHGFFDVLEIPDVTSSDAVSQSEVDAAPAAAPPKFQKWGKDASGNPIPLR